MAYLGRDRQVRSVNGARRRLVLVVKLRFGIERDKKNGKLIRLSDQGLKTDGRLVGFRDAAEEKLMVVDHRREDIVNFLDLVGVEGHQKKSGMVLGTTIFSPFFGL